MVSMTKQTFSELLRLAAGLSCLKMSQIDSRMENGADTLLRGPKSSRISYRPPQPWLILAIRLIRKKRIMDGKSALELDQLSKALIRSECFRGG